MAIGAQQAAIRAATANFRVGFFPLEAMEVTGKSKIGESGRKVLLARVGARASQLAPIVAELRRGGLTSRYGIARELNKPGIAMATGRGKWDPGQVRRVMERAQIGAPSALSDDQPGLDGNRKETPRG